MVDAMGATKKQNVEVIIIELEGLHSLHYRFESCPDYKVGCR